MDSSWTQSWQDISLSESLLHKAWYTMYSYNWQLVKKWCDPEYWYHFMWSYMAFWLKHTCMRSLNGRNDIMSKVNDMTILDFNCICLLVSRARRAFRRRVWHAMQQITSWKLYAYVTTVLLACMLWSQLAGNTVLTCETSYTTVCMLSLPYVGGTPGRLATG